MAVNCTVKDVLDKCREELNGCRHDSVVNLICLLLLSLALFFAALIARVYYSVAAERCKELEKRLEKRTRQLADANRRRDGELPAAPRQGWYGRPFSFSEPPTYAEAAEEGATGGA